MPSPYEIEIDELRAEIERLRAENGTLDVMAEVGFNGTMDKSAEIARLTAYQNETALAWTKLTESQEQEIARLTAALEPFAEVARWAERNGHDLTKGWDMLLRKPDGGIAGHLQVQSPEFIAARDALEQTAPSALQRAIDSGHSDDM